MNYVAIYRALSTPPPEPFTIARGADYAVHLHPGPVQVSWSTGSADPRSPTNTIILGQERRVFPEGSYVIVVTTRSTPSGFGAWTAAKDRIAQLVAVLDLEFPGIAHEKVFEGPISTPSMPMHVTWEEGFQLERKSYAPSDVTTSSLQVRAEHVLAFPEPDAQRFVLASRWFQRANDATNSIDRVLFYYTVLEVVCPKHDPKGSDVPKAVAKFLADHVFDGRSPDEIKARLNLGRICGFRGEIVHRGKATVMPDERAVVTDHVERLQAIARTCLRVLAGFDANSELDRFMVTDQS